MKRFYGIILALAIISTPAITGAHPFGIKFWGHRIDVIPRADAVQIDYVIEVPITKLTLMMNRFKNTKGFATLGPKEEALFNKEFAEHLQNNILVQVDGEDAVLTWNPNYAKQYTSGETGFFEYHLHLISPLKDKEDVYDIEITNNNYPLQRAVFHNEIGAGRGAHHTDSNVNSDMGWEESEDHRKISFKYHRGDPIGRSASSDLKEADTGHAAHKSILLSYLKDRNMTTDVIIIALVFAFLLGALHSLSPGHGKALVAAYLVGSRGTVKHAIALGGIVTLTHISSVIILGLIGLILAQYIVPEYYTPFVSLASGLLICGIGCWLFIRRLLPQHHHHHIDDEVAAPSWRQLFLLGIAGGIVPCPSATAVMLTAIAIGKIAWGFVLIFFFSLGLATVLIAIGVATVKASSFINRIPKSERLMRYLPIVSATAVVILGVLIIYYGFWMEWIRIAP